MGLFIPAAEKAAIRFLIFFLWTSTHYPSLRWASAQQRRICFCWSRRRSLPLNSKQTKKGAPMPVCNPVLRVPNPLVGQVSGLRPSVLHVQLSRLPHQNQHAEGSTVWSKRRRYIRVRSASARASKRSRLPRVLSYSAFSAEFFCFH